MSRALPKGDAELLDLWAISLNHPPAIRGLFVHELLFRDGAADYWMPIQEPVKKWLIAEVKPGAFVDLYIMRIGSSGARMLYVINEFQEPSTRQ